MKNFWIAAGLVTAMTLHALVGSAWAADDAKMGAMKMNAMKMTPAKPMAMKPMAMKPVAMKKDDKMMDAMPADSGMKDRKH